MKRINIRLVLLVSLVSTLAISGCKHPATSSAARPMTNVVVASQAGKFYGWPANNGLWRWAGGREILVGFSFGDFVEQQGHNLKGRSDAAAGVVSRLARSLDGGRTWTVEDPENCARLDAGCTRHAHKAGGEAVFSDDTGKPGCAALRTSDLGSARGNGPNDNPSFRCP